MTRRGWVGWVEENRLAAGGVALCLVVSLSGVGVVFDRATGVSQRRSFAGGDPSVDPSIPGNGTTGGTTTGGAAGGVTGGATAGGVTGGVTGGSTGGSTGTTGTTGSGTTGTTGVIGTPPKPCKPASSVTAASGDPETGITRDTIRIGQIVTDVPSLPQQLRPNYEGLAAYVRLVNRAGGVCGRKIEIDYRNDQINPTTHASAYSSLANSAFAFVANSSLLDSTDYETSSPFDPTVRDSNTGEFVPDVGGLAYAYGRSQSRWHAGTIGSVSPVMVGGGQFRFFVNEAKKAGKPCRKAGVVYLVEPTHASEDQARLGAVSLERSWGGNMGANSTSLYSAPLAAPVQYFQNMLDQMIAAGVNCVFTYADLGSNVNLAKALPTRGVWPPDNCTRSNKDECFQVVYIPFAAYDPAFIRDGGEGARFVSSYLPHLPLKEASNPSLKAYIDALAACRNDPEYSAACGDAEPSTFSIIGFTSGILFVEAVQACGSAPNRACVMDHLRKLKGFIGGGLLGPVTPFRSTRATDTSGNGLGTWDWKWIFTDTVAVRVLGNESNLIHRFHRVHPTTSFFADTLHVARGTPA